MMTIIPLSFVLLFSSKKFCTADIFFLFLKEFSFLFETCHCKESNMSSRTVRTAERYVHDAWLEGRAVVDWWCQLRPPAMQVVRGGSVRINGPRAYLIK